MAKEYIEREAAIAAVDCTQVIVGDWIRNNIQKIPAADVRPVVRGRWIESYSGWTPTKKCSACGTHFTQFPMKIVAKGEPIKPVLNFCPNCGTKMDGGQDDA